MRKSAEVVVSAADVRELLPGHDEDHYGRQGLTVSR